MAGINLSTQEENEMYEWLMQAAAASCNKVNINSKIFRDSKLTDDIVQEFVFELSQTPNKAYEIYKNKNIGIIKIRIIELIDEHRAKMLFKNKMDYSRYKKIERICTEFGMTVDVTNAYKISELMDRKLSIPVIINLIKTKKPTAVDTPDIFF